jgi:multiple antibiotic resistance protein
LATLTAFGVGLLFVAVGKAIFSLLGIEVADFLMAGGIILLI